MRLLHVAAGAATLFAMATPALAQPPGPEFYGTLGYSFVNADESGDDVSLGAIMGRAGIRFMQYVGVEGEAQFGVSSDSVPCTPCGSDVDIDFNHDYGAYLVGFLPLGPNADVFARIGYGSAKVSGSAGGVSISTDDDGGRWGAGAQFFFDGVNGLRGEYTRSGDFSGGDFDFDVFTISFIRRFR